MMQSQTNGKNNSAMQHRNKTQVIALCGLLASLGLIFSYVEVLFPLSIGVPGVKLGIANLVVIIALYKLGEKYALPVNVIRILVAGLLFNGAFGALYSLAGALLSFAVMCLLKRTNWFSIVGVSMAGGVAHNLGQLLVAASIIENLKIFIYFPVLLASGMITGIVIGIVAHVTMQKLKFL